MNLWVVVCIACRKVNSMMRRRLTARKMFRTAIRLPPADRELWFEAAKLQGVSQIQFLRDSLRARAARVLRAAHRSLPQEEIA